MRSRWEDLQAKWWCTLCDGTWVDSAAAVDGGAVVWNVDGDGDGRCSEDEDEDEDEVVVVVVVGRHVVVGGESTLDVDRTDGEEQDWCTSYTTLLLPSRSSRSRPSLLQKQRRRG